MKILEWLRELPERIRQFRLEYPWLDRWLRLLPSWAAAIAIVIGSRIVYGTWFGGYVPVPPEASATGLMPVANPVLELALDVPLRLAIAALASHVIWRTVFRRFQAEQYEVLSTGVFVGCCLVAALA